MAFSINVDWTSLGKEFVESYLLITIIGLFFLVMFIRRIIRWRRSKKGGLKMMDLDVQIRKKMIEARMRELRVAHDELRTKEFEAMERLRQEHQTTQADIVNEYNILQKELDKLPKA